MTSVSSSKLPTGSRTERSTTSLIASRFRERCDPFWSCGRSTNKSSVVVRVTARFGRRIWTGLTTPVTPTLFNRNPFATRSLWTSFGIDSTRRGLPARTLKTCRRQCAELHPLRSKRQRKRSRGPLPALRRGSPEALAGGRWLGGGLLSVSAETDEAVVVEGDRPHLPGRLDRLRRLHLDVDRVVVLLLDLLRRVLDFLGEGREVRLRQMVDDALDDRDDHVADDLHRFIEGHLVPEPVQRIVLHDDHAVRFATELLEPLSSGFGPALDFEREDRDADRHGPVRAGCPSDDGCGSGARGAPEARDDEDDVRGERVPEGAFLVLRRGACTGDPVLVRRMPEQDLHVAFGLREPGRIRVHRDRFDALDVAVVQRAHHLAARAPDSDDGDLRVDGILKQAADDFFDVIPWYHSVRPPLIR